MRTTLALAAALSLAPLALAHAAHAAPRAGDDGSAGGAKAAPDEPAWCAPEVEALGPGLCHIDGGAPRDGRRTLVVFLHGAIAKHTKWQWTQERALLRQAKQSHFEAIFPRAPVRKGGYLWPGRADASEDVAEIVAGWMRAKKQLEARHGKPFDDVFVMGFSSGAYFVSALAMRAAPPVDGFAVFAGGVPAQAAEHARRPPVFVGVCAKDKQTARHSRSLGASLAALGWPHRVDEERVGHAFSDVHVAHAIAYLRAAAAKAHER